jgi:hypothetical protein
VNSEPSIEVGDRVESILTGGDAVGIVLELHPGLVDGDAALVQWTNGKGLVGLRTLHAVKALRKLPVDTAPLKRYLRGTLVDLDLLDKYLAVQTGTLPVDAAEVRHALAQCPTTADPDLPVGLPLSPAVADAFNAWLVKDAQRLAELGQDTMSALLQRITVDP